MITNLDLAELVSAPAPFNRAGWIFELKYDGFRMLAAHRDGRAELVSRRGRNFAERFPEITAELLKLSDVVMDGELVILDNAGRPHFGRLSRRSRRTRRIPIALGARTDPATLFVFDLLQFGGDDLRARPLSERKALLGGVLAYCDPNLIRFTRHIEKEGMMLFEVANGFGLEGIVAKRADAPYRSGRSGDWIKVKTPHGRAVDEERARARPKPG